MKVLVTGASGFIGAFVTRALLQAGHTVSILAYPEDPLWRLKTSLDRLEILRGTLQELDLLQDRLQRWAPQACIHLAWYAEPGLYLDSPENLTSLQGSLNLARILSALGCECLIGAGTCAEYELKTGLLDETDRTQPGTLYAASKLSFQMLADRIAARSRLRFAWGRIFYLYGPQEDSRRLVPSAILRLLKGLEFPSTPGEQVRDYLHVADVAAAFVMLMESGCSGIYNICSAQPVTVKGLLQLIGELVGRPELLALGKLPYRQWEPEFVSGNNDRLKQTGWTPRYDLRSGLRDTIDWWRGQPDPGT